MLRFIVYLVSVFKLLGLGKWYPPAHVRDVSIADFRDLVEAVDAHATLLEGLAGQLDELARLAEATRKKIYREEVKQREAGGDSPAPPGGAAVRQSREQALSTMKAGDEVPPGLL